MRGLYNNVLSSIKREDLKRQKSFLGVALGWVKIWAWESKLWALELILRYTAKLRFRFSKKLIISSPHLFEKSFTWDDIEFLDQWGLWLPLGCGLVSRKAWEQDNELNKETGLPLNKWESITDHEGWITFHFNEDYIRLEHYFTSARKYLAMRTGKKAYKKELEFRVSSPSQECMDIEEKRYLDWVQAGKPEFKIKFSDQAKKDLTDICGDQAKELWEKREKDEDTKDET